MSIENEGGYPSNENFPRGYDPNKEVENILDRPQPLPPDAPPITEQDFAEALSATPRDYVQPPEIQRANAESRVQKLNNQLWMARSDGNEQEAQEIIEIGLREYGATLDAETGYLTLEGKNLG